MIFIPSFLTQSSFLLLEIIMASQPQKLASALKRFFGTREMDPRTLLRGATNLSQLLGSLGVLPENALNVINSSAIFAKPFQRKQLLCMRRCKCSVRKRHCDVALIQAAQPDDEIYSKFIFFLSWIQFFFSTVAFCFV
jgi:DNA polymerase III delta subunit